MTLALVYPALFNLVNFNAYDFRLKSRLSVTGACVAALLAWISLLVGVGATDPWPFYQLIQLDEFTFTFTFSFTVYTLIFYTVVTTVNFFVQFYSLDFVESSRPSTYFTFLNLLTVNFLFFLAAGDLFLLLLTWEVLSVFLYLFSGYWNQSEETGARSNVTFSFNLLGSVFLFAGFIYLAELGGSTQIDGLVSLISELQPATQFYLGTLLLFGIIIKTAQFPFYAWLSNTLSGPLPGGGFIQTVILPICGIYFLHRFDFIFSGFLWFKRIIVPVGLVTAIFGALVAARARDLKKFLSFSSLSQLGLLFAVVGNSLFSGAIFHLLNQAFARILIFLSLGVLTLTCQKYDLFELGGLGKIVPVTAFGTIVGSLSLAGIPPFGGFWSYISLFPAVGKIFSGLNFIYFVGLLVVRYLTIFYSFRLIFVLFVSNRRPPGTVHEDRKLLRYSILGLSPFAIFGGFLMGTIYFPLTFLNFWALNGYFLLLEVMFEIGIIFIAYLLYVREVNWLRFTSSFRGLSQKISIFNFSPRQMITGIFVYPVQNFTRKSIQISEKNIIEPAWNSVEKILGVCSTLLRFQQPGQLSRYLRFCVFGLTFIILCLYLLCLY